MGSSNSFVKFDKVDKSYDGEVLVVKDLNVDIPKGEFLTMLGPFWFWKNHYINDVSRI